MPFDISFDGVENNSTWNLESGIARGTDEGKVVKMAAAAKTAGLCIAEDKFFGILKTIEIGDEIGGVVEAGYHTVSYSGTAPSVGMEVELVADGAGGVKIPAVAATGIKFRVPVVDTGANTLVLKLKG